VRPPTLPAGHDDPPDGGFTVLEIVCVLAIFSLVAAIALPFVSRGTSGAKLKAYATSAAATFKADRNAAVRRQVVIATEVEYAKRMIRSGATGRTLQLPDDMTVDILLPGRCSNFGAPSAIIFFPSGMSCGGVLTLSHDGLGFEVRVNWLTGGIEIAPAKQT
jgi:general secretion pathway protein H